MRIQCSNCGNQRIFKYTEIEVKKTLIMGWNSYGDAFYCPECVKTWEERKGIDRPLWGINHTKAKIERIYLFNKNHN